MTEPTKIKVSGESGVVMINIQEHPSLGRVIRVSDIGIYFPNSVGLSYSVGEVTCVCSGSDDSKSVLMPPEGWTAPVYTAVIRKADKKFSFSQWKKDASLSPQTEKKQKTHCTLEIGVMVLKNFDLVKVRRSSSLGIGSVALDVRVDASADDILEAAMKQHLLVHKDMEDTDYALLYPHKSRVKYVPGKDLAFTPSQYLRYSTLSRFRDIKLYICTVDEYNAYRSHRKEQGKMSSGASGKSKDTTKSSGTSGKSKDTTKSSGASGKSKDTTKSSGNPSTSKDRAEMKRGVLKRPFEEQVPSFKGAKVRKEVSFKPHLDIEDCQQDSTLTTDGSSELQRIDKYGFIEVTYSHTAISQYDGHNESKILFSDCRHAMDHVLGYEPTEEDITCFNPSEFGMTIQGIEKGGKTFLATSEDGGYQFPCHTGQSGLILHGPDVIHGYDGHGFVCGVVAISHQQPALSYSWTRNGVPICNGSRLSIISITQTGSYQCTVTYLDRAEISEMFQFEAGDKQQKKEKNEEAGDEQQKKEKNEEAGDKQRKKEKNEDAGDEQQNVDKNEDAGNKQQTKEKQEVALQTIDRKEISFKEDNEIGRGSYGVVYKGQWSGTTVAVKVIQTRQIMRSTKSLMQEAQIHTKLSHPNILQLMGICVMKHQLLLLTPFIYGSNLEDLIFKADGTIQQQMDDEMKGYLSWQAAKAVAYLHNLKPPVLHQDIKPANFILEEKTKILRLMDLGLAILKSAVSVSKGGMVPSNPAGTPMYTGPEIYLKKERPTECSDVWSLACTLTELSTGAPIWENEDQDDDVDDFVLASFEKLLLPTGTKQLQAPMKGILLPCFTYETQERVTAIGLVSQLVKTFDNTAFLGYEI